MLLKMGKYAPDIEDVKAVSAPILRHRIVKNYLAEADGLTIDNIIKMKYYNSFTIQINSL